MIREGEIPAGKLAYFRERLKNRLHEVVFLEFLRQQDTYGLSKAELGRRIGKPPERITRLLAAPGNWTLDTVSDLLLGMGSELDLAPVLLVEKIATERPLGSTTATPKADRLGILGSLSSNLPSQSAPTSTAAQMTGAPQTQGGLHAQ